MPQHLLSARAAQLAKPKAKPYRLFDGQGLALLVSTTGVKSWQLRYRLHGKEQTATLGKFGTMSLAAARLKADVQRKLVADGKHLTQEKLADKKRRKADAANTFGSLADAWIKREARRMEWSPDYRVEVESSLENHLSPLRNTPISGISASVVAPLLLAMEDKAPHMIEKVRRRLRAILDDAVEHGQIAGNPLPALRRRKKIARRHYPALVDLPSIGALLRSARAADPCKGIYRAHLLLVGTALRISEIAGARWDEFDLDGIVLPGAESQQLEHMAGEGNWRVPRERMKNKDTERGPHVVPLPPGLLASLRAWREIDGPHSTFVCPAPRDSAKPITIDGVEKFYRDKLGMAGKHSPHSWRSALSTIAREAGRDADAVESQLDHLVGNSTQSSYDRAKRLEIRRALMKWFEAQLIAARDITPAILDFGPTPRIVSHGVRR